MEREGLQKKESVSSSEMHIFNLGTTSTKQELALL